MENKIFSFVRKTQISIAKQRFSFSLFFPSKARNLSRKFHLLWVKRVFGISDLDSDCKYELYAPQPSSYFLRDEFWCRKFSWKWNFEDEFCLKKHSFSLVKGNAEFWTNKWSVFKKSLIKSSILLRIKTKKQWCLDICENSRLYDFFLFLVIWTFDSFFLFNTELSRSFFKLFAWIQENKFFFAKCLLLTFSKLHLTT